MQKLSAASLPPAATSRGLRLAAMRTTPNEFAQAAAAPLMQAAPAARRHTVLLAEDDRSARRYFEIILQRAGYEVIAAADGVEAMKAALSEPVDAVVADAIMPHLGGRELCRFLRSHPKLAHLPVVLLSGADKSPGARVEAKVSVRFSERRAQPPAAPEDQADADERQKWRHDRITHNLFTTAGGE